MEKALHNEGKLSPPSASRWTSRVYKRNPSHNERLVDHPSGYRSKDIVLDKPD